MGVAAAVNQNTIMCLGIITLILICTAFICDELSKSYNAREGAYKCGWTRFQWDEYDWSYEGGKSYTVLCHRQSDGLKSSWCSTSKVATITLTCMKFATLFTLIGTVRIKWAHCCCRCDAFIWFMMACVCSLGACGVWFNDEHAKVY